MIRQCRTMRRIPWFLFLVVVSSCLMSSVVAAAALAASLPIVNNYTQRQRHTSNHAVILSTSRYWFNYRHVNNALAIYHLLKHHGGIPDENIILMMADEIPVNPRNSHKNGMYISGISNSISNLMKDAEIDYRGDQVTVENLSRVLLGLYPHNSNYDESTTTTTTTSSSLSSSTRILHTDQDSNLLLYWTGHGGDGFFKFQDVEEITGTDIQRLLQRMYGTQRYKEVLFMIDTCQAFTLADEITAPHVYTLGSSLRGENSYAHHHNVDLGVSVIERYTNAIYEFIQRHDSIRQQQQGQGHTSLQQALVDHLHYDQQHAHIGVRQDFCTRNMTDVPLSDFFANVQQQPQQQYQQQIRLLPNSIDTNPSSNRRSNVAPTRKRPLPNSTLLSPHSVHHKKGFVSHGQLVSNFHHHGYLQPTDVSFLFMAGIFLLVVVVSSQRW